MPVYLSVGQTVNVNMQKPGHLVKTLSFKKERFEVLYNFDYNCIPSRICTK